MIFRRIYTEGFVNLPNRWWEFLPGLQLVRGPNEAGKTALRRALTLALFQDAATTDKKVLATRTWGAGGMKLQLEFDHAGTLYRIERDFEEGRNLLETGNGATRWRNKEKIREQLRQILPIPDEAAFRASACMAQDELRIEDPDRLHDLIEQRVISAGGVNVVDLISELKGVMRERHKGETRAAQHPGIFRTMQDKLAGFEQQLQETRRELEQCEHAAGELKQRERELAAAEEKLKIAKERERRHRLFFQANKDQESKARELLRIEEHLKQADKLDRETAELQQQASAQQGPLRALDQQVQNAEQRTRLQQQLTAAGQQAERLEAQSGRVAELQSRIEALRVEAEKLPVRKDEAENAFYRLPQEIAALEKALGDDRAEQQRRQNEIASGEQDLSEIRNHLAAIAVERPPLQLTRNRAASWSAAVQQLEQQSLELRSTEGLVQQLAAIDQELRKAGEAARTLPEERFRQLRADIEAYRAALSAENMVVWAEAAAPIRVSVDGAEEALLPAGQEVPFQRRAELSIGGSARVTVENRTEAAAQLARAEAGMSALLRDCNCATHDEFQTAVTNTADARKKQIELRARRSAMLAGRRAEDLQPRIEQLKAAIADLNRNAEQLAVPLAEVAKAEERLKELDDSERKLRNQEAATQAHISALCGLPSESASMRQNRQELERKKTILEEILRRASVEQPAGLRDLVETIDRIERTRTTVEAALASELGGARADDLMRLLQQTRGTVTQLRAARDAVPAPDWPLDQLEQKKLELRESGLRHDELGKRLGIAQALRSKLDTAKLKQERDRITVQLVAANQVKQQYEQYRMDPEEALKVEDQIRQLESQIPKLNQQVGTCRRDAQHEEGLRERLTELEEQVDWWNRRREKLRLRDAADQHVQEMLDWARDQAVSELRSRLPVFTQLYLEKATCGRYRQVQGEGLTTSIYSSEKGAALETYELSSGTAGPLYVAIRLAAVKAMFGDPPPPLLLDDLLVHCDPARRAALLQLLADFASSGQAILFTCQDYPEYAGLPSIDMGRAAAAG